MAETLIPKIHAHPDVFDGEPTNGHFQMVVTTAAQRTAAPVPTFRYTQGGEGACYEDKNLAELLAATFQGPVFAWQDASGSCTVVIDRDGFVAQTLNLTLSATSLPDETIRALIDELDKPDQRYIWLLLQPEGPIRKLLVGGEVISQVSRGSIFAIAEEFPSIEFVPTTFSIEPTPNSV